MKILAVNKFYFLKGGSEKYYFNLSRLLEADGHEIVPFSMKGSENIESVYNSYFVENIDYSKTGINLKVRNALKILYSFEAKKKIEKLICDTHPNLAHLHIFQHQLSPSIIHGIKKAGMPVVNTVHDFKVICPNYQMLNSEGVCERCRAHKYYNCLLNRCMKGSVAGSLIGAFEAYLHYIMRTYTLVDRFVCPSKFIRKKMNEFGVPEGKTVYIPNFVDTDSISANFRCSRYFAYIGRLSAEKGVATLIKSMRYIRNFKLIIVGTGPMELELKQMAEREDIQNVVFAGFKKGKELYDIISDSMFTVIPSEWYENAPLAVLESMACGKPVIGSNIGGIPELIEDGVTGKIFSPGDSKELGEKISYLIDNPAKVYEMGRNSRKKAEQEYNPGLHYNRIMALYSSVLDNVKKQRGD